AEVSLIFEYEGNLYRVTRVKPRGKTTILEFQILQDRSQGMEDSAHPSSAIRLPSDSWKPLTERTLRETEAKIQRTLRLDYETFVNASFFLQGKADQFTQQRPSDRKRILGSILGLEVWETYRQRAAESRRSVEAEISSLDGRLHEIASELEEEHERKQRLKSLEGDLSRLNGARESQEAILANVRQIVATLEEQQKMVDTLARQLDSTDRQFSESKARYNSRSAEREQYTDLLSRADQIKENFSSWQNVRSDLERWELVANDFRESEKRRHAPLAELQAEQARLEQEMKSLREQQEGMRSLQHEIQNVQPQIDSVETGLAIALAKLDRLEKLQADLHDAQLNQKEIAKENKFLRQEMEKLKQRIDNLSATEEAICPTCGRMLNTPERLGLIDQLTEDGADLGDSYRLNQNLLDEVKQNIEDLQEGVRELGDVDAEVRTQEQKHARLTSRLEHFQGQLRAWEANGAPRLDKISHTLEEENFALEARKKLAQIDSELKEIGYDAAAHDAVRLEEAQGRESQAEMQTLEKARAAMAPLEREIKDLEIQADALEAEITEQKKSYSDTVEALANAQSQAPDLYQAERGMMDLQEQENRLRLEVGAARQKVNVLDDLKVRRKALESEREGSAQEVAQYKQLERAFGKDGVPALLIEQSLPQIETKANEILDRLSGGGMSVRFITQAAYKDAHRQDLRETLDIQISDSAGVRDYEMYSGGEAFRVNFALRLALSEVLAQRAGARLQTLVIDEGFGSQDALGRQRLIEAINMVKSDFAKILVITHIEELKDAFPTRIEVEKTERGSVVRVD
ncbi:MAG: SMC family ATPase, partial [Chloroflexota bacterium]|nr:SMC family ATPase [Chloroflexota bacterium]